jgi:hypothetical protein
MGDKMSHRAIASNVSHRVRRTIGLPILLLLVLSAVAEATPASLIDERDGWMQLQIGVSFTTPSRRPSVDIVCDIGTASGIAFGGVLRMGSAMGLYPEIAYYWSPASEPNLAVPIKIGLERIRPLSVSVVAGVKGYFTEFSGPEEEYTYLTADVLAGLVIGGGPLRYRAATIAGIAFGLSEEQGVIYY